MLRAVCVGLGIVTLVCIGVWHHRVADRQVYATGPVASPAPGSPGGAEIDAVRSALSGLRQIARPSSDPEYRRVDFGPAWNDTDGDGCSQRRNALAAAVDRSRPLVERRRGRCARDVIAGTWADPYTGQVMTFTNLTDPNQAQQIPIDHIVALANAYRYGARAWTPERRLAFATDLFNLQPTARATNLAKSDHDAASWRPRQAYQCSYAARYVAVKAKYGLAVDATERRALASMLDTCR